MSAKPRLVGLTDEEVDAITLTIDTEEPTLNVAPLLHEVTRIVAEREAAARDEVFDEAWAESEPVEVEVRLRRPGRFPEHVKTWSAATTYLLPAPASRPAQ